MIKIVVKIDPGVNSFHLLFKEGPRWNKIDIPKNTKIRKSMLINLRPISKNGLPPYQIKKLINKKTKKNIKSQEELTWKNLK